MKKHLIRFFSASLALLLVFFASYLYTTHGVRAAATHQNITNTASLPQSNADGATERTSFATLPTPAYTLESAMQEVLDNYTFEDEQLAYFYYSIEDGEEIICNGSETMIAASTIKVPLAMVYYDKITAGELSLDDTITFYGSAYEIGGEIPNEYYVGQEIPLDILLEYLIVYSDNSAANILIEHLGDFSEYRSSIFSYSNQTFPAAFYQNNYTNANYQLETLKTLYSNRDSYEKLIQDMEKSAAGEYLQAQVKDVPIAHKYGNFDGYLHDYGIVFAKQPYIVGIDTSGIPNAEQMIAALGEVIWQYHQDKYQS